MTDADDPTTDEQGFGRDAAAWLAEMGVERRPIRIDTSSPRPDAPADDRSKGGTGRARPDHPPEAAPGGPPEQRATEPGEGPQDEQEDDRAAPPPRRNLEEEVSDAVAYARRSTAQAPKSESKLRDAMTRRGIPSVVVDQAMDRCRKEGLVDDPALAAALVEEGRTKGHAPLRLRRDLARRGLPDDVIDTAVAAVEDRDQEARAYDLAADKASRMRDVDDETAFRRIVGYVARRGYTEAIARRVARQAVFNDHEPQRTAER